MDGGQGDMSRANNARRGLLMTRYGRSLWIARASKSSQVSFARFRGPMVSDVAIIGGGLTGCAAAYLLAAAGIKTALFEAGQIGQGGTSGGSGAVRPQPSVDFDAMHRSVGRRAARQIWEMSRLAALDLAALVRRLSIRCDLTPREWLTVARGTADLRLLERMHKATEAAGIDATWFRPTRLSKEVAIDADGAIRTQGAAFLDPYRACLGFAKAAAARGARIYERSSVERVRADRAGVEIQTDGGSVAARAVVVATAAPGPLFKPLGRHFALRHTYIAATPPLDGGLRRQLGRRDVVLGDISAPARCVCWTRDDRLVVSGADQTAVPERRRAKAIVQRTGQLMYELSLLHPPVSGVTPAFGWDALVAVTRDGLFFAGPHRNYPHHLFALGLGHHGPAASLLAARILFRQFTGAPEPGDELFGFNR
jgi:glycine/D-amino acid oxidase-like deaminating enzyme